VIGNLAVLLAAVGVFGTRSAWHDVIVAAIMGSLGLQGAAQVSRDALKELRPSYREVATGRHLIPQTSGKFLGAASPLESS
jgi:Co/Zn/Cd efflux system component